MPRTSARAGVDPNPASSGIDAAKPAARSGWHRRVDGRQPAAACSDRQRVAADADGTYSANEQALINELKTKLNLALAALRAHGIISP